MAIAVGFFVTAIIQSSSATTVMVVGFVNAALMNLRQAIGVILGANIGTTVTGWIVAFKVVKFSMPIIGIGVFTKFFSKNEKWKYVGDVIFGFGILFLGMQTMKMGFAPLRDDAGFINFFTKVDGLNFSSIILGVLIGAFTTFVVQSSSATLGITIALASQGLLNFEGAVSLLLGQNIGTTITAILASIGTNYQAKRAAIAHTLFNTIGVILALILFYPFVNIITNLLPGNPNLTITTSAQIKKFGLALGTKPYISSHIALAHTFFNIINVVLFIPFINVLAKICENLIPTPKKSKKKSIIKFAHIDFDLIKTPAIGIIEAEKELLVMAQRVNKSAIIVQEIISKNEDKTKLFDKVFKSEKIIDEYQRSIAEFLISLSSNSLSVDDATSIGNYLTFSHNLEKFADHLEHITLIFEKIYRNSLALFEDEKKSVLSIFNENIIFFDNSLSAFTESVDATTFMNRSQVINRRIKTMIKDAKISHFERLGKKIYKKDTAVYFVDILNFLDGMRSQAYNISEVTSGTKFGN
jgi:phosphate:Na+ symporter